MEAAARPLPLPDSKAFATLQAQAALAGITLHQLEGDFGRPVFVATRRALTRQFDTIGEVAVWLQGIAGVERTI